MLPLRLRPQLHRGSKRPRDDPDSDLPPAKAAAHNAGCQCRSCADHSDEDFFITQVLSRIQRKLSATAPGAGNVVIRSCSVHHGVTYAVFSRVFTDLRKTPGVTFRHARESCALAPRLPHRTRAARARRRKQFYEEYSFADLEQMCRLLEIDAWHLQRRFDPGFKGNVSIVSPPVVWRFENVCTPAFDRLGAPEPPWVTEECTVTFRVQRGGELEAAAFVAHVLPSVALASETT